MRAILHRASLFAIALTLPLALSAADNPPPNSAPANAAVHSSGRPLPKMPAITQPVMFDTPAADRILEAMQIFPVDSPWNEDISRRPVAANSQAMIATIGGEKPLRFNSDMAFILVPPKQPLVPVNVVDYPDESDAGPFPVPENAPIEGWPLWYKAKNPQGTLDDLQRNGDGDRHLIVVDPTSGKLYEFFGARKTDAGWQAAQASIFDLTTNKLRPDGWTSADAAGLPIFPATVRFDELERGEVEHAMRVTIRRSRKAYVYPATHFASRLTDENLPRMGERLRLKADYDLSRFSPHSQAILKGLKKYGMLVADNGLEWCLSVAPDPRIKGLEDLRRVKGGDFEVIVPTGPTEGPRAK